MQYCRMPAALPALPEVSEPVLPPIMPLRLSSWAVALVEARVRTRAIPARAVFMTWTPGLRGLHGINLPALDGCVSVGYARRFDPVEAFPLPRIRTVVLAALLLATPLAQAAVTV